MTTSQEIQRFYGLSEQEAQSVMRDQGFMRFHLASLAAEEDVRRKMAELSAAVDRLKCIIMAQLQ